MKKLNSNDAENIVINKCKELNYQLLETFLYKNCKSKIYLKCNNDNHKWISTYENFITNNKLCAKCKGVLKLTQNESEINVINRCVELNYVLLNIFIYIGNKKTRLELKCNKDNYFWDVSYNNFINHNYKCPKCNGKLKLEQKEVDDKILKRCEKLNYILIEPFIYENSRSKIHLKCIKDNHEWFVMYYNFINSEHCCPECSRKYNVSENKIKELLEINKIEYIYQYKNKDIFKRLSLDFYLPKYNIAIECQGKQHFFPVSIFGGEENFKKTIKRDKEKYDICQNNKIKLLYFVFDKTLIHENYFSKIFIDKNELIKEIIKN